LDAQCFLPEKKISAFSEENTKVFEDAFAFSFFQGKNAYLEIEGG
jgi:hypothetical protein